MAKGVHVRIRHITDESVAEIGPESIGKTVAAGEGLVWVDFDHTDESGMAMLPDVFDVRSADVADCHVRTPVPKLHRYPDHHYTAINGLARGTDDRLYFVPLKVFQHPGLVVTVLGPISAAFLSKRPAPRSPSSRGGSTRTGSGRRLPCSSSPRSAAA